MNVTNRITKGIRGWSAEARIPVDGLPLDGHRFLKVTTHKTDRGELVTSATLCKKEDGGGFSFVVFQDYSKTVIRSKSRCTEKNVEVQQQTALNDLQHILADVRIHYAKAEAA